MIRHIQVYELNVPPSPVAEGQRELMSESTAVTHTCIVEDPSFRPVLNNHSQGPYTIVDLHICSHHTRVFQCQGIVDIHVACEPQLRIPDLYNGDFRM